MIINHVREGLDAAKRAGPARNAGNEVLRGGRNAEESSTRLATGKFVIFDLGLLARLVIVGVDESVDRWVTFVNRPDGLLDHFRRCELLVPDIRGKVNGA